MLNNPLHEFYTSGDSNKEIYHDSTGKLVAKWDSKKEILTIVDGGQSGIHLKNRFVKSNG